MQVRHTNKNSACPMCTSFKQIYIKRICKVKQWFWCIKSKKSIYKSKVYSDKNYFCNLYKKCLSQFIITSLSEG